MINFQITKTWNGEPIDHPPIQLNLKSSENGLCLTVEAPFFDDPPPEHETNVSDGACDRLWDFEVVEAFFLNDNNDYLEVELNPYDKHLVLMLKGQRNCIKDKLPLNYNAIISDDKKYWTGEALIPWSYFPYKTRKFNAFAIHGVGECRVYEALFPVQKSLYEKVDL
ncbi:DgyrCDS5319 [Dimorphilus gyrociliatus]|uniref:DgyrCDS5319 n=1 Tax=Dimorphilus gyrociliatus TaxID=2664684 RepID=A0A7I8VM84_9ANNE|nr:DgyrCDS5319 [Dimorphilus gyrociliatus]